MKNLIKNSLIVFAVIILTVSLTDSIIAQAWNDFSLYLEIGLLSIIICLINCLTDKFQSRYYLLDIMIQFVITLALVLLFGYVFHWYQIEGIWLMCSIVVVAYVICFFLGVLKTRRDIALINKKLETKKLSTQNTIQN